MANEGVMLSLGERWEWRGRYFAFCPSFSLFKSIFIDNKQLFPKLSLFCPWQWLVSDLAVLVSTEDLFHLLFLPVPSC